MDLERTYLFLSTIARLHGGKKTHLLCLATFVHTLIFFFFLLIQCPYFSLGEGVFKYGYLNYRLYIMTQSDRSS
jgi:hypothetical protein